MAHFRHTSAIKTHVLDNPLIGRAGLANAKQGRTKIPNPYDGGNEVDLALDYAGN